MKQRLEIELKNIELKAKQRKKVELNENEVRQIINTHEIFNIPYKISISNYAVLFESSIDNIHFLKNAHSKQMFSAYQKIKSDLKELPNEVNMHFIKYYQTNFRLVTPNRNFYADKIYQVDINSCYANLLFNNGLLSENTLSYLKSISKENRLASVGMLASKKNVFEFHGKDKDIIHSIIKNPLSDYFFFCVQETYKIMNDCKEILGKNFLFSWVDAIYFTGGKEIADKIINHLQNEFKLYSSFNVLKQFEVELRGDTYRLRYLKNDEPTFMNIPTPEQREKRNLVDFILSKKYNNNIKKQVPSYPASKITVR